MTVLLEYILLLQNNSVSLAAHSKRMKTCSRAFSSRYVLYAMQGIVKSDFNQSELLQSKSINKYVHKYLLFFALVESMKSSGTYIM